VGKKRVFYDLSKVGPTTATSKATTTTTCKIQRENCVHGTQWIWHLQ